MALDVEKLTKRPLYRMLHHLPRLVIQVTET